eukprot:1161491-Pelagomonas_calceolata.AAC.12
MQTHTRAHTHLRRCHSHSQEGHQLVLQAAHPFRMRGGCGWRGHAGLREARGALLAQNPGPVLPVR